MIEPRLYIIMREDLWDMNPGKSVAQGAHAQAEFDHYILNINDFGIEEMYKLWCDDRKFGVTTILHSTLEDIYDIVDKIDHTGTVIDPSYPWRNFYGMSFTSEEITCAWAFVFEPKEKEYMKQFNLHC